MEFKDIAGKDIVVKCSAKEEFKELLEIAEKDSALWVCGQKPTKQLCYFDNVKEGSICIKCTEQNRLFYNSEKNAKNRGYEIIDFSDFIQQPEKYSLEIKRKGRKVIATLFDKNGKYIEHAKATCHSDDTFDFETGKKIALQRLFNIDKTEPVKIPSLKLVFAYKEDGEVLGNVGTLTELKAFGHIKLYIGDVVECFDEYGQSQGLRCVVKDRNCVDEFVMGNKGVKFCNGMAENNRLIVKRKSYIEMSAGDVVGCVKYVLR